jgi:hypothetical protein
MEINAHIAFRRHTNDLHRNLGQKYANPTSKSTREAFVKKHRTRFTQLSRLPYFDLVRSIVIDFMHNLILSESSVRTRDVEQFWPCGIKYRFRTENRLVYYI